MYLLWKDWGKYLECFVLRRLFTLCEWSRFPKQLRPDTTRRLQSFEAAAVAVAAAQMRPWKSRLERFWYLNERVRMKGFIRSSNGNQSRRSNNTNHHHHHLLLLIIFLQNFIFLPFNIKMSSKQGSSSMFGSSSKSSQSSNSWNKSGSSGSGYNSNNGSKGVSEKMWKDLTEKMAKLDIEIDYRKK